MLQEEEELKVGDEVWVKAQIIQIHNSGDVAFETVNTDSPEFDRAVARKQDVIQREGAKHGK